MVASGRKLNLGRDTFPRKYTQIPKNHFKTDYPLFHWLIIGSWTSLDLRWLGLGGQTVKNLLWLTCKFDLDQNERRVSSIVQDISSCFSLKSNSFGVQQAYFISKLKSLIFYRRRSVLNSNWKITWQQLHVEDQQRCAVKGYFICIFFFSKCNFTCWCVYVSLFVNLYFFILQCSALKIFEGSSLNFINQTERALGRAVDRLWMV